MKFDPLKCLAFLSHKFQSIIHREEHYPISRFTIHRMQCYHLQGKYMDKWELSRVKKQQTNPPPIFLKRNCSKAFKT